MPPANTPRAGSPAARRSPSRAHTPPQQRPLTPLSYLSSPVPDLAATLHTTAADEADEANVAFLRDSLESLEQHGGQQQQQNPRRSRVDSQRDPRRAAGYQQLPTQDEPQQPRGSQAAPSRTTETAEDLSRRERLQRVLTRLNRLHDTPPASSMTGAYGNRTPSPTRQSLYDWAPAYEEGNNNNAEENELDAILAELRRQQPDTHPDILRVLSQSQLEGAGSRTQVQVRLPNGQLTRPRAEPTPASAPVPSARERDAEAIEAPAAERRLRERERRRRETEWLSLRSRAALQRIRQEGAGSPSATERMLRHLMERERSGLSEEEERARGTGWFRPSVGNRAAEEEQRNGSPVARGVDWGPPAAMSSGRGSAEEQQQQRIETSRRETGVVWTEGPPAAAPAARATNPAPSHLEAAIQYLEDLRVDLHAGPSMLSSGRSRTTWTDDCITDIDEVRPLPYTSWLEPGASFEGHQHATTSSGGTNLVHNPSQPSTIEQINPHFRITSSAAYDAARPWLSHRLTPPATAPTEPHDHWPVRVLIHSVDSESMTLQGTMEAYDVPQHPSSLSTLPGAGEQRAKAGRKSAPIVTYLEGQIIDLRTHGFATPDSAARARKKSRASINAASSAAISFPAAGVHTDAKNWLKLPPFSDPSASLDEAAAALLLSSSALTSLHEQYIFMRWKERCFIHGRDSSCTSPAAERLGDRDRGHGLTISGFYYVSLRRSDGEVRGLYFDPASTPFQHLALRGVRGGCRAACGLR